MFGLPEIDNIIVNMLNDPEAALMVKRTCRDGYLAITANKIECAWVSSINTLVVRGNFDMFKYLHANGATLKPLVFTLAAIGRRLDFIQYAFENGCSWDKNLCELARRHSYLEILEYAVVNGCPQ